MNKKGTLKKIAKTLREKDKKVQLIYAFNGTGKTRLSLEFKDLISSEKEVEEDLKIKILYYNAFTEDLFYWDNDLKDDLERKLKIHPNKFTKWIFEEQGQELNVISKFQHYTNDKLTPYFNDKYSEITFSIQKGDNQNIENIKISKGEESILIWSVFYNLLDQVIEVLNVEENQRETDTFNSLEYVFIDDPVSSLDENHLIELAVNLSELVKKSNSKKLKFIITTHSPLFYNVLYNELRNNDGNLLRANEDGSFELISKKGDSNKSFSYHLYLIQLIEEAINNNAIQKYHFMLLRNVYEKTAGFLGYPRWSELLPENKKTYYNRIIQFTSHSTLSNTLIAEPTNPEKKTVEFLLNHLKDNYSYYKLD